jgi:uncharacterized protein DUF6516
MPYRSIEEYFKEIRHYAFKDFPQQGHSIVLGPWEKDGIRIIKTDGFLFDDGSVFRFKEYVRLTDEGQIEKVRYTYEFVRHDGFFFHYDKDPDNVRDDHPLCHLHANEKRIRYLTHEVDFEEILLFLLAVFYP